MRYITCIMIMKKKFRLVTLLIALTVFLSSCGNGSSILNNYTLDADPAVSTVSDSPIAYAKGFASGIGVVANDAPNSEGCENINSEAAILVDATNGTVLFQKNVHQKEYPASTTKILTALLALKYGDTKSSRKIGDEVLITEDNVVMCDFRMGDTIPFEIIIHGALMMSGNDAAAALALFASDDLDDFAELMNKEAKELGATESHFVNPHGLYDDDHYTTAYDMYLIFNEAIKYDDFVDVLSTKHYTNSFIRTTSYGEYVISCQYNNTNRYVMGEREAPDHVKVIGGKSGFTEVAKRSYVMLAESGGHRYIMVIMRSDSLDTVYEDLDYLLNLIPDNSSDAA